MRRIEVYELELKDQPPGRITGYVVVEDVRYQEIDVRIPQWVEKVYARLEIYMEGP